MVTVTVQHNLQDLIDQLTDVQQNQVPFVAAKSLTQTVKAVQAEVKAQIPHHFTVRRNWILGGIVIDPATKTTLTARVFSRDKFMALQESGGIKRSLHTRVFDYGDYLAIALDARRTKTDVVRKEDWPQNLIKPFIIHAKDGRQYLAVRYLKNRKGAKRVMDDGIKLMYVLKPKAELQPRLKMQEIGKQIAADTFVVTLTANMKAALASVKSGANMRRA